MKIPKFITSLFIGLALTLGGSDNPFVASSHAAKPSAQSSPFAGTWIAGSFVSGGYVVGANVVAQISSNGALSGTASTFEGSIFLDGKVSATGEFSGTYAAAPILRLSRQKAAGTASIDTNGILLLTVVLQDGHVLSFALSRP